jgi:hypothetical protein
MGIEEEVQAKGIHNTFNKRDIQPVTGSFKITKQTGPEKMHSMSCGS